MLSSIVSIILSFCFVPYIATTKPVVHKYVNAYVKIWDDSGSGAHEDVSIWRPLDFQSGYYPLGDVAVGGHSQPKAVAITVSHLASGALAPPAGFTEIWRDSGSGANGDVKIFRMNPRSGYVCLGHVAHGSYSGTPDANKYRQVQYVCCHIRSLTVFHNNYFSFILDV